MRQFITPLLFILLSTHHALAFGAIACTNDELGWHCAASHNSITFDDASRAALQACSTQSKIECSVRLQYFNDCAAAAAGPTSHLLWLDHFPTPAGATRLRSSCNSKDGNCVILASACDATTSQPTWSPTFDLIPAIVSSTLAALIILLLFAFRTSIINFVVQGNLPTKLPVYGEDIQVLFQRTQRLNWYGRVVFGVVARLAMTHQQLADVRKYWLGRVVAFDSLRRRRQNELARMHLQLAATVKGETKGKTPLSQFLTMLKVLFLFVFYLFRALFSFLFGFLFIRVTIAKLVRGTLIESKDLVLVLQAKQAVEDSTKYLKEYLTTANTFNGREEMFDTE